MGYEKARVNIYLQMGISIKVILKIIKSMALASLLTKTKDNTMVY